MRQSNFYQFELNIYDTFSFSYKKFHNKSTLVVLTFLLLIYTDNSLMYFIDISVTSKTSIIRQIFLMKKILEMKTFKNIVIHFNKISGIILPILIKIFEILEYEFTYAKLQNMNKFSYHVNINRITINDLRFIFRQCSDNIKSFGNLYDYIYNILSSKKIQS